MVLQLSQIFTILLFHYDGQTSEWDEFEWSKRAIHDCGNLRTIIFLLGMKTSGSSILIQRICPPEKPKRDSALIPTCHHVQHMYSVQPNSFLGFHLASSYGTKHYLHVPLLLPTLQAVPNENFTILLFHYDGQTSDWDEFEWSKLST
ncbi:hypothetical protein RHMOL_Rhmol08G0137400 [Rhododendron molle]|uniref:Uncharacterized protein n=1 Tax=Rhododendron molle TaxID=49168 RepID=A0ACC0MQ44_RHOML|nr:hypothetical protein RHMOL_Rhmol08G0137400 [Rhododendron molle]